MNKDSLGYGHTGSGGGNIARPTSTIAQFCADHNISRTHLHNLQKAGKGPRLMKLGRRILISAEAAADWRRHIEFETAGVSPEVIVL